jgi:hypothetical protein
MMPWKSRIFNNLEYALGAGPANMVATCRAGRFLGQARASLWAIVVLVE